MEAQGDRCARRLRALLPLGVVGLLAFVATLLRAPERAWAGLLLGNLFFLNVALCGTVLVALTAIFSGAWSVAFRRVPEAVSAYLPVGLVVMLAIALVGGPHLYPWMRPEEVARTPLLQHKAPYLNTPFFIARLVVAFAVWILFSSRIRWHSRRQDEDGSLTHTRALQRLSAGFLVAFGVTFIFTSFDWLMSLQPKWFSTLYPGYTFASLLLTGAAAITLMVLHFYEEGLLPGITEHHRHELARLLCATSTFWAYIWFCQYMLIYYTNIPEEATYFSVWRTDPLGLLFPLNLVLGWLLPIVTLISPRARRSRTWLARVCLVVLAGRWLDLYLLIAPSLGSPLRLGLPEVLIPLALLPLFVLPARRMFLRAEPVPKKDPYLVESLHMRA